MSDVHIKVAAPSADTPGFLKWAPAMADIIDTLGRGAPDPSQMAEYLGAFGRFRDLLLPLVVEPTDRDEAVAALEELSLNQLLDLLSSMQNAITSAGPSPKVGSSYDAGYEGKSTRPRSRRSSSKPPKSGAYRPGA